MRDLIGKLYSALLFILMVVSVSFFLFLLTVKLFNGGAC